MPHPRDAIRSESILVRKRLLLDGLGFAELSLALPYLATIARRLYSIQVQDSITSFDRSQKHRYGIGIPCTLNALMILHPATRPVTREDLGQHDNFAT